MPWRDPSRRNMPEAPTFVDPCPETPLHKDVRLEIYVSDSFPNPRAGLARRVGLEHGYALLCFLSEAPCGTAPTCIRSGGLLARQLRCQGELSRLGLKSTSIPDSADVGGVGWLWGGGATSAEFGPTAAIVWQTWQIMSRCRPVSVVVCRHTLTLSKYKGDEGGREMLESNSPLRLASGQTPRKHARVPRECVRGATQEYLRCIFQRMSANNRPELARFCEQAGVWRSLQTCSGE